MRHFEDLDGKLSSAVRMAASDPVPQFAWDAVKGRAAALPRAHRGGRWPWALALAGLVTFTSGAAALASPQASKVVQGVLASIHVLHSRSVTLAQARADANYPVITPSGLPDGTSLTAITELPGLGAAPAIFMFQYAAPTGTFEVAESPPDGLASGSGSDTITISLTGLGQVVTGIAIQPGSGTGGALQSGTVPCPLGTVCTVQGAAPPSPGGSTLEGKISNQGDAIFSWTVGGTQLTLINPGTLTQAEVEAIRTATR